jgi:hypothetical protein
MFAKPTSRKGPSAETATAYHNRPPAETAFHNLYKDR